MVDYCDYLDKADVIELIKRITDETNAALEKQRQEAPKESAAKDQDDEKDNDDNDKEKEKEKTGVEITVAGFTFRSTWQQRVEDLEILAQRVGCVFLLLSPTSIRNNSKHTKQHEGNELQV